mmetsp:Transcript_81080/g.131364  ORF Transcript_81080/g.131364 Transcript_81080/m.131364 type:complete len:220 (+) Transcript_81080:807-1466(+)
MRPNPRRGCVAGIRTPLDVTRVRRHVGRLAIRTAVQLLQHGHAAPSPRRLAAKRRALPAIPLAPYPTAVPNLQIGSAAASLRRLAVKSMEMLTAIRPATAPQRAKTAKKRRMILIRMLSRISRRLFTVTFAVYLQVWRLQEPQGMQQMLLSTLWDTRNTLRPRWVISPSRPRSRQIVLWQQPSSQLRRATPCAQHCSRVARLWITTRTRRGRWRKMQAL